MLALRAGVHLRTIPMSSLGQETVRGAVPWSLTCLAACTITFSAWTVVVTGHLTFGAVLLLILLPAALCQAGRAVAAIIGYPTFFAVHFLLGSAVFSFVLMTLKALLPVPLPLAAATVLGIALLAPALLPRRWRRAPKQRTTSGDFLAVLLCLAAATAWAREVLRPIAVADGLLIFKPWADYFTHASYVARMLPRQSLLQIGNYECSGHPAALYHYASYVFPACLAAFGKMSAYQVLCAFWTPFGTFLSGLAAYALGRSFWGAGAGFAAVAAVLLLPDASFYGVRDGWYRYAWLQQVAPAGLYGVAVAAAALLLVMAGTQRGDGRCLLAGLTFGAMTFFYKAHVFVPLMPLLIAWALLAHRPVRWSYRLLGGVLAVLLVWGAATFAHRHQIGPNLSFDGSGGSWWMQIQAEQIPQTPFADAIAVFRRGSPVQRHLVRASLFVLIATFGVFVILYPAALLAAWRRRLFERFDWIPLGAVAIYLTMTLGLQLNKRAFAADEMIHRPFVWAYFVVAVFTAGRLFSLLQTRRPRLANVLLLGCLPLLLVPWRLAHHLHRGEVPFGRAFTNRKVDAGLAACARFVRKQSPADALTQDSLCDTGDLVWGALCQHPSFLARPEAWKAHSSAVAVEQFWAQQMLLAGLQRAASLEELHPFVAATGVRWYLRHPGDPCFWPAAVRDDPVFQSQGYKVYDFQRIPLAAVP